MMELQARAAQVAHQALCRIRYMANHALTDEGRRYLMSLADATHNIPCALVGEQNYLAMLPNELATLEELLSKPQGELGEYFADITNPDEELLKTWLVWGAAATSTVTFAVLLVMLLGSRF